jgi:choloylglycine hydrolase
MGYIWSVLPGATPENYWFSLQTPATFWAKLDDLDLKAGASVKKLQLARGKTYSGNAVSQFVDAKLFVFQDLTDVPQAK